MKKKRIFSSSFKTKVVLEALKEQSTLSELSSKYNLEQPQISKWKHDFLEKANQVFERDNGVTSFDKERTALYAHIGKLEFEIDFLKKKL
jgi:transposase-like protein